MVINFEDVNDNAPQFINSVSPFGRFNFFYREAECHHAVITKLLPTCSFGTIELHSSCLASFHFFVCVNVLMTDQLDKR